MDQRSHVPPTVTRVVEGIQPMQLNNPTPCVTFTVHDVLAHMIVLGGSFAYLFRGEEPPR